MDTTDTLQIKITEARNLLTKESREAIDNVNWKLIILGMNKKYNPEQLENLETETELLLCGILNPENYPVELETRMHLTKEGVDLLIGEMDKLIFKKIQEKLEDKISEKGEPSFVNKPSISNQFFADKLTNKTLVLDPRFMSMPKGVQEAIANSNWKEKLYNIAEKYKLPIQQMGVLEEITIKVMKDEIHPDKYESELASKITIVKEDISNLVNDVNEDILKNIRESMKKQEDINNQEKTEEIPLPPYAKIETKVEIPKVAEPLKPTETITETINIPTNIDEVQKVVEPIKPIEPTPEITNIPKNIIEEKLKSATVSDHTISDYSSPKISSPSPEASENNSNPSPKSFDPYREQF